MRKRTNFNPMGDRYLYDLQLCTPKNGWAQLDTNQDASYYGNWVNPILLQLVSYCEGDICHIECDSETEFVNELTRTIQWHAERAFEPKIDGMMNPAIIEALKRLGFAEWLH